MTEMKIVEYGKQTREVILLLHGGGLSWWNYRSEAELLSDRYHVVLPILDGHADSDEEFESIEENAARIISHIDREYGGAVLFIGGLSLGAQILVEMLSQRKDICRYAMIESASVIPSRMTNALIGPMLSSSFSLIRKKWFAGIQFRSLHIRNELFEDYFRDTVKISKENMIAFLKANTAYEPKPALQECRARVRIIVGGKEQKSMLRSAHTLRNMIPESVLEVREGLFHGEFSLNYPEQYAAEIGEMLSGGEHISG